MYPQLADGEVEDGAAGAGKGAGAGVAAATLLIVDDDPTIRVVAGSVLRDAGYRVVEAACGEDGLAAFDAQPIDLVLLDVLLPGIDGFDTCGELRARPGGEGLPILMMTELDDRGSIDRAYESGATDFMTKPIAWGVLPHRVRYALRGSRALHRAARTGALLARSEQLAQMGSWEWVCATDTVRCSDELLRICGISDRGAAEMSLGAGLAGLLASVHADDRDMLQQVMAFAQTEGEPYGVELRIVRPDGELRQVFEQTDVERDASGGVVTVRGIRRDITQQVEAANRIQTLAYFDPLTGLANRVLFNETTQQWLAYAERRSLQCAVLFIDLDRFKVINETLGPAVGDGLLQAVGERLRDCVRASDVTGVAGLLRGNPLVADADGTAGARKARRPGSENLLARLGGDQFTVLLVDVGDRDGAAVAARRIMRSLQPPLQVDGHELTVTVSVGIAMAPHDGGELDLLLRNASTAMNVAKDGGRNQLRFYVESMSADRRRRLTLESDLRRALDNGELSVHYQAKVDARSSSIIGAEALLRWHHPLRGTVRPVEFIPVAEESGLIVPITDWVIGTVCRQIAAWRAAGVPAVPVSVNLDGKSMQNERLLSTVSTAMADSGVGSHELEFEVTESGLMRDLDRASALLAQLKQLGLKLSIDDFGTGHSSLTYLKRFPVDVLKIDRSFVKDLLTDPNDAALTAAIIAMGLSLKLELVAEGVENWEQADFMADHGCHLVQGFLFAKPLPGDAFATLLHAGLPARRPACCA